MRKTFKIIVWGSIWCFSFTQVGLSEEMSKEELQKRFEKLKMEYLRKVDPLRYQFYTRTGKFTNYKSRPSIEDFMYSLAGAVYGRVEKTCGIDDPPSTLVYIKPYRVFKEIIPDSTGYVIVREFGYGGTSSRGEMGCVDKFQVGETVLVFLDDIPNKYTNYECYPFISERRMKEIISLGSLIPGKGYYYERASFGAWSIKNDTLVFKHPGGLLAQSSIPPERIPFSEAIKIMEQIEREYKEAKEMGKEKENEE